MNANEIETVREPLQVILDEYRTTRAVANQCFRTSYRLGKKVREVLVQQLPHYAAEGVWVELGNLHQGKEPLLDERLCRYYSENLPPATALERRFGPEEYHAWLRFAGAIVDLTFLYSMAGLEHSENLAPHILFVTRDGTMLPNSYPFDYVPYRRWDIDDIIARGHR